MRVITEFAGGAADSFNGNSILIFDFFVRLYVEIEQEGLPLRRACICVLDLDFTILRFYILLLVVDYSTLVVWY